MQTILVLTDYSDAAFHAIEYACMLSRYAGSRRLILLNVIPQVKPFSPSPSILQHDHDLVEESHRQMNVLADNIRPMVGENTQLDTLVEDVDLGREINAFCRSFQVDLVVMGITGRATVEKVLIGSNTMRMINSCDTPLLIVPGKASSDPPHRVVLAVDVHDKDRSMKEESLQDICSHIQPHLMVLNVAHKEKYDPALREEITNLHQLFDRYMAEYHYTDHPDTAEGISDFVRQHKADMVITVHRKDDRVLKQLFRKSISKRLAWHTTVPLLVLPE